MPERLTTAGQRRLTLVAILLLASQAVLTRTLARTEHLPSPPPLESLPRALGEWQRSQDVPVEPAVAEMLGPDDLLNRNFVTPDRSGEIGLFVAYYKTQHKARNAHDPKVCLPGSGWAPTTSKVIDVSSGKDGKAFRTNYMVVANGPAQAVVLYWYQTHDGILTREQELRLKRVVDTVVHHRTDMALVRIVAPISGGGVSEATESALRFARVVYPHLVHQFPPIGAAK